MGLSSSHEHAMVQDEVHLDRVVVDSVKCGVVKCGVVVDLYKNVCQDLV